VGNYLSGGIDSSVTTLLTDELRSDRFQAFAIAFEDENYDESHYQKLMAERLKADLLTVRITDGLIRDNIERAVWHGERPLFRTAPIPLLLLADAVRTAGIRVVLTGEAADEILWGYDAFKELKLLRFWSKHPDSRLRPQLIRKLYPHLAHYRDSRQFGLMRMFYEGFLGNYDNDLAGLNMRVHNNKILINYLRADHRPADLDGTLIERVRGYLPAEWQQWSLLQKNQFLEMRTLLQGYLLSSQADRMSLAHGIEGRYPFLDHELLEWVFHLPSQYKLPLLSQKHLLRESFRDDLPAEIVDRPKQPYQSPDLKALMSEGRPCSLMMDALSPGAIDDVGLFDRAAVERFLNKFARGTPQQLGYRDNMLAVFLLTTQLIAAQVKREWTGSTQPVSPRTVDIVERTPA
jgi:asparagine synthase (glutamine-hydrolysing)